MVKNILLCYIKHSDAEDLINVYMSLVGGSRNVCENLFQQTSYAPYNNGLI